MALKGQSIRKGVDILLNNKVVEKQVILDLSQTWTEAQENFFKKMIKQGGKFKIQGIEFEAKAPEPMLTSQGEKDSGIIVYPE
jgi:preprotein translocase subunit SecB